MSFRFPLLRNRLALLALPLATLAFTSSLVRADDMPKFSDPEVTAYVKSYSDFSDHYAVIMKEYMAAVKSNDTAKMQESAKKVQGIQTESAAIQTKSTTISGKLKPDEAQAFSGYMQKCAQKMADAAKPQ